MYDLIYDAFHPAYQLVVKCQDQRSEISATQFIRNQVKRQRVTEKIVDAKGIVLNMQVRLKDNNTEFVNALLGIHGVTSAVLTQGKERERKRG